MGDTKHLISSYMGGAYDSSESRGPKIVSAVLLIARNAKDKRELFVIYKALPFIFNEISEHSYSDNEDILLREIYVLPGIDTLAQG